MAAQKKKKKKSPSPAPQKHGCRVPSALRLVGGPLVRMRRGPRTNMAAAPRERCGREPAVAGHAP